MKLVPVPRRQAFRDAVNLNGYASVPLSVAKAEQDYWAGRLRDEDVVFEGPQSISGLFAVESAKAYADSQMATHFVAASGLIGGPVIDVLRAAASTVALSRLLRGVPNLEDEYQTPGDEYRTDSERKMLVDNDLNDLAYGAGSLILHKKRLVVLPFEEKPTIERGTSWYSSPEDGLYVSLTTPAKTSDMFMDGLAMSVGGMDKAEALLDAENAVNIRPYLSINYLLNVD